MVVFHKKSVQCLFLKCLDIFMGRSSSCIERRIRLTQFSVTFIHYIEVAIHHTELYFTGFFVYNVGN